MKSSKCCISYCSPTLKKNFSQLNLIIFRKMKCYFIQKYQQKDKLRNIVLQRVQQTLPILEYTLHLNDMFLSETLSFTSFLAHVCTFNVRCTVVYGWLGGKNPWMAYNNINLFNFVLCCIQWTNSQSCHFASQWICVKWRTLSLWRVIGEVTFCFILPGWDLEK